MHAIGTTLLFVFPFQGRRTSGFQEEGQENRRKITPEKMDVTQLNPSTQIYVAYDVRSSSTQNITYLVSRKVWEIKLQAKKDQYFNTFSLFWSK